MPEDAFLIAPSLEYAPSQESINPKVGEVAKKFDIELVGESRAAIVNKKDLAVILSKKASLNNTAPVIIKNLDALSLETLNYKFNIPAFTLRVRGTADFQTLLDKEAIKSVLLEKSLKDPSAILDVFPEIGRLELRFSPFWLRRVPANPARIDIILK